MKESFSPHLKIGVLGGGQLGSMLIQEAINFGLDLHIMDLAASPCRKYSAHFINGDIRSKEDVLAFGSDLDILTIEIENVNTEALFLLEKEGIRVYPQASVIELIQDKGRQKEFYEKINVPTASYKLVTNKAEILEKGTTFPVMQKLRKGGYDGRGVQVLKKKSDINQAFDAPSVLEKFVDLDKELSVIVARSKSGEVKSFPLVEQEFNPEANLVEFLFSPAEVTEKMAATATKIAVKIITKLNMIGILAVEFFLDKSGNLFVNEIAPRPHNSGHQTIEGNYTSQFEQHLRAILDLPLGSTAQILPSVMVNLLGSKRREGKAVYVGIEDILKMEGVYPHIYGKMVSKPFRKMGHVTVLNADLNKAKGKALFVKETVHIIGK